MSNGTTKLSRLALAFAAVASLSVGLAQPTSARNVGNGALILASMAAAPAALEPLVIRDDPGGRVDWRGARIADLYRSGQPVELRGECMSACTMYLALPNACVAANATFGFHGPSFYGLPLNSHDFETWSQYIAAHYPPAIARWYLTDARYSVHRARRLSGAELIRLGVPACG